MRLIKIFSSLLIILLIAGTAIDANAARHKKKKKKKAHTEKAAAASANDSLSHSIVEIFPASIFTSSLKAGFEAVGDNNKSLMFMLSYGAGENSGFYGVNEFTEFSVELQYKIYLQNKTKWLQGFYMAPYLSFRSIGGRTDYTVEDFNHNIFFHYNERVSSTAVNPGYLLGYQKNINDIMVINIYGGGGINIPNGDYSKLNVGLGLYKRGVIPHFGLGIGLLLH